MEKRSETVNTESPGGPCVRSRSIRTVIIASLLGVFLVVLRRTSHPEHVVPSIQSATFCEGYGSTSKTFSRDDEFDWASVKPSPSLKWVKCYNKLECARLSVPLDYANTQSHEEASIAIVRLPAKDSSKSSAYRGPLLMNPGGPGGSGTSQVRRGGEKFQKIVGGEYDIVGFDPRGVGYTTPNISIFTKPDQFAWSLRDAPVVNSTPNALAVQYARAQALGHLAYDTISLPGSFVSTAFVARDMLSIVHAHGREKINYWGFSYGSVLGATFASMFPDKIERFIIDGVVDAEAHYQAKQTDHLVNTDEALLSIYEECVAVGPSICPIYASNTSLVAARVTNVIEALRKQPLPLYIPEEHKIDAIDADTVERVIFRVLYKPHTEGKHFTNAIASLEEGNGRPLWEMTGIKTTLEEFKCDCAPSPLLQPGDGQHVQAAIACSDAPPVNDTLAELDEYLAGMALDSPFARFWTRRVLCSGWQIRAKERYSGSFQNDLVTSYPILLVGNTMDPVTPSANAHKMSTKFKDSVVLTQNNAGHCSSSAASLCTAKHIKAYFQNGTLPAPGTACKVESSVFGLDPNFDESTMSVEERELLIASYELHRADVVFIPDI